MSVWTEETQPLSVLLTEPDEDPVIRWHFKCKRTAWGKVFNTNGIAAAFSGSHEWWQERRCVVCNKTERRRVELEY